jgi:hypothetical protein
VQLYSGTGRTVSGIISFFQSGTGLTGCRTIRYSGTAVLRSAKFFCFKTKKI